MLLYFMVSDGGVGEPSGGVDDALGGGCVAGCDAIWVAERAMRGMPREGGSLAARGFL